ncbi:DUF4365 domain-containing protein [Porphyromonas gingivicanis]|uniref:DUF4365 domain-containing protein n=1 Tax=Porphyromonas gingivicanis TaxID=266762 RepID=UPI00046F55B8|nr:DUF4365 domain-containing protein [Porphyromonas gingivicanis]
MTKEFPQRTKEHVLEETSGRFLQTHLPQEWICRKEFPDYGVDYIIIPILEGDVYPIKILVQLKSSKKSNKGKREPEYERQRLKVATYNLLKEELSCALLIKYVEEENEAYYIFIRDIPEPPQGKASFTVKIPRSEKLSTIDWASIFKRVSGIHSQKKEAGKEI